MMHSSDEDIELCSIELFTKKHKNNQKILKISGTVRRDKFELVRLSSVRFDSIRFGSKIYLSSIVSLVLRSDSNRYLIFK